MYVCMYACMYWYILSPHIRLWYRQWLNYFPLLSFTSLSMPSLCGEQFLECIKQLLREDSDWVPAQEGYSIYIRPTAIGTSPFLGE